MIPFTSSILWARIRTGRQSSSSSSSAAQFQIIEPPNATISPETAGNHSRIGITIVIAGPTMESKSSPSGNEAEEEGIGPLRDTTTGSNKSPKKKLTPKPVNDISAASSSLVSPMKAKFKSDKDEALMESLDCRLNRPLHAGPFLTVQRRRRRRKYVRTYLFKDPTLIDDLSSYQTNFVLERINNWPFNAFVLDNVTGGRPLPNLCVHLFKSYGLFDHFNLDPVIVWKLFSIIEDGYHWRNPYHNAVHSSDVTQAMHCFLQEDFILEKLTPLEIFSAIVGAATHDLDHPGVNQPFLVATSNHLASLYKNSSVLENHHWRSAMGCLNESGVSAILGPELVKQVEIQIKELVLATDITRQPDFLATLKKHLDESTLDMNLPEIRQFVLQIALKCADISNPCRPWEISRKWSIKVCEEFFRQGDYERQLNLPVTPQFDRYSSSVPKIQIGFFNFIVRPLFVEWHRMMDTQLSKDMMHNLDVNKTNWDRLLVEETQQTEETDRELIEIPQHLLTDEDTISLNADIIAARKAFDGETAMQNTGERELHRSVRFDTTITTASDSENSEGDEAHGLNTFDTDMLLIPRPDGRRHSIATGLMGSNIQLPPQFSMKSHLGGSSHNVGGENPLSPSATARMIGKTVIRRESLPGTLMPGKALSTKTILHLQKIRSAAASSEASGGGSESETDLSPTAGEHEPSLHNVSATVPVSPARLIERSSCSSSTTDEILDFTFSLPETIVGGRSSGSPSRRLLHETTDFDELCPGTSILSMSPSVTQLQLQHGIAADLEEQRRHLIRQQTCPVVSLNADGTFNRPRFLSAAAAISPTTAATSSIISQRMRNKSPESGAVAEGQSGSESHVQGRGSGGSSSEALLCCEVISEEGDRQSTSSSSNSSKNNSKSVSRSCSHEASPLEIFVQQFPPGSDDNDGEAPRRESGSLDTGDLALSSSMNSGSNTTTSITYPSSSKETQSLSNLNPSNYSSPDNSSKLSFDDTISASQSQHRKTQSTSSCEFGHCEPFEDENTHKPQSNSSKLQDEEGGREDKTQIRQDNQHIINTGTSKQEGITSSVQTAYDNIEDEKENFVQDEIAIEYDTLGTSCGGGTSSSSRIATILMWRNNRLWRSLTEEDEHSMSSSLELQRRMYEKQLLPEYCTERWDLRFSQQLHQGVVGGRLQIRRGSAPTTAPAMGCRGAQDRRSDPTQYHSSSCLTSCNNMKNTLGTFLDAVSSCSCNKTSNNNKNQRRCSVPVELIKQAIFRPIPSSSKKQILSKTGRRGSLPCETAANNLESSYAHKWLHVFPYHEDDSIPLKRRSSGGPEIFAAAQRKISSSNSTSRIGENWKAQILIEHPDGPETSSSTTGTTAYWQGPRRGSLPVDVYIASSAGSCSSESESSGDASDT